MILVTGNAAFEDICLPLKGKNEWGVDTLVRKVKGARALGEDYITSLAQGDEYVLDGTTYRLQTWDPDEDPIFATVVLNYKGLAGDEMPAPTVQNQIVSAVGNTSADYSAEGDPPGLGRLYRTDLIAATGEPPLPGEFGTSVQFFRKRYAIAATMEFLYQTVESHYRYIVAAKPTAPIHDDVDIDVLPVIERARITTSDGAIFGKESMVNFDLEPELNTRLVSFLATNIIGTPFWEVEEVVRQTLETPDV